jgi:hypothetical protein
LRSRRFGASGPVEIRDGRQRRNLVSRFCRHARSVGIDIRSQPIFPKKAGASFQADARNGSEPILIVTIDGPEVRGRARSAAA